MGGKGTYGWYGKIPELGDFVRSGFSQAFIEGWDRWTQEILVLGKAAIGERWFGCYMGAPIWRFALAPGLCGPNAAAGVMMPSVDRIGRQFPLCLGAEFAAEGVTSACSLSCAMDPAFPALEAAALRMLQPGSDLAVLNGELCTVPKVTPDPTGIEHLGARSVWVAALPKHDAVLTSPYMPRTPEVVEALFNPSAIRAESLQRRNRGVA